MENIDLLKEIKSKLETVIVRLEEVANIRSSKIEWLTGKEVCVILGISSRTLQNYRDLGKIGFAKIGRKTYYKTNDVESLIEEHFYPKHRVGGSLFKRVDKTD
jgi:excisionase family DNA binding protein